MARWDRILSRGNVEDRRSAAPVGFGGMGGVGLVAVLALFLFSALGGDTSSIPVDEILDQLQQSQSAQQSGESGEFAGADQYETFTSAVLGSSNEMWAGVFTQSDKNYTPPKLVLFRGATLSGCGVASSQVGPHYCPYDSTIYLDETFFEELQKRFGAKGGDVAEAYVIAHEVGHHVQNELGIMGEVQQSAAQNNELAIALELQADCFAGVWAHSVGQQGVLEPGEIAEAMDAAAAVGDDRIQQKAQGQVNPESWTHGSSAQRVEWFTRGYESGKPSECNTFQS